MLTVTEPAPTEVVCIKRALSTWSLCGCASCKPLRRRMTKLRRAGLLPARPDSDQAWARIWEWTAAGYTPAWIASACGLNASSLETALSLARTKHTGSLGAKATARVLAADIEDATAGLGPALVARRRLQALACHGWDGSRIQAASGISFVSLCAIRRAATDTITAAHHHQIAATYADLSERFGGSAGAKARAKRLEWAPPWAWDDIADPDETPSVAPAEGVDVDEVAILRALAGESAALTTAERVEAVAVMTTRGMSAAEIAERLHCTERTVNRDRAASHIPSTWRTVS